MNSLKDHRTNWIHILIWAVLVSIVGGGILVYTMKRLEKEVKEEKPPSIGELEKEVLATSYKKEYTYVGKPEGMVKLAIKNNLNKSICFESCNTCYLLQKKDTRWENVYEKACEINFVKECISPNETKIFEYVTIWKEKGIFKFAVPVCVDCENLMNSSFREDGIIYSNEFTVTKLNVTEETNLSLKIEIDQNDISSYRDFIENNKQYQKPISMTELRRQIENTRAYLETNPSGKITDDLREKIIEELNIGFLLDGLTERELAVTTVASQEYEEYIEKELLFEDPQVGTFSVLLLIPKENKSYPAIVGLHGHGDNNYIFRDKYLGKELAKEGFVVIMLSFRAMFCDEIENNISEELLSNNFSLMGLRVYEALLLIKYLKYKDFVDESRIGIMGHSGGSDTANLVSRISPDIKAGVYDFDTDMLNVCGERGIHCETNPGLGYYNPQINDRSTLGFPFRMFEYGYPGENDKQEVIEFFKEKLGE